MSLLKALTVSALGHMLLFSLVGAISFSGDSPSSGKALLFIELKSTDESNGRPDEKAGAGSNVIKKPSQAVLVKTPFHEQNDEFTTLENHPETELISHDKENGLNTPGADITLIGSSTLKVDSMTCTSGVSLASDGKQDNYFALLSEIKDKIQRAVTYPPLARKRKMEGTVLTGFYINEKGMPQDIEVLKSSGYKVLDDEAVRVIKRALPYPSLKERIEVPISFRLMIEPP